MSAVRMIAEVGHVKILLSAGQQWCAANLVRTSDDVVVRGGIPAGAAAAELVVNARVEMDPVDLERLVRSHLETACRLYDVDAEVRHLKSLRPGRPNPTFRYGRVIDPH